jgi:hypothetical protein
MCVRLGVLTAMKMLVVIPCSLLCGVDNNLQNYMVSQPEGPSQHYKCHLYITIIIMQVSAEYFVVNPLVPQ